MKELHHEIAPILTKVYRSSLSTGTVPNDWKTALVAPVYKKGSNVSQVIIDPSH